MWPPFTVVHSGISSSSYTVNLGTDSLGAGKNGRFLKIILHSFWPEKAGRSIHNERSVFMYLSFGNVVSGLGCVT